MMARMADFMLLMHAGSNADSKGWPPYLTRLREGGWFRGGSSMAGGVCVTKGGIAPGVTAHLVGYIRIRAEDLAEARSLVTGNPVYEAGGVVEVRELADD